MPFTISQAITRIDGQPEPVWSNGMTSGQKLQRINEALEKLYILGTWDGLLEEISLSPVNGIITLDPSYYTIEALKDDNGIDVSIKTQMWKYSKSAPIIDDWAKWHGAPMAFDKGDIAGSRTYEIAGDPSDVDAIVYKGMARKRYVWAVDTSTVVSPDCFEALLLSVRSLHWQDVGDMQRAEYMAGKAVEALERILNEVLGDADMGHVTIDGESGGGTILNLV